MRSQLEVTEMFGCKVNPTAHFFFFFREKPCWSVRMSSNGRSTSGTGIGFLNHHDKNGSKMMAMMDLDQDLFPSTASFGVSFCFH